MLWIVLTIDTETTTTSEDENENVVLRTIHSTSYNPATGQTVDKLNDGEEAITTAPDYANRKVSVTSDRGLDVQQEFDKFGRKTKDDASPASACRALSAR